MPNLPPPVWAELSYSGAWNDITEDVRATTSQVTVTRGLSSESSSVAAPTACTCDLDSRDDRYAPRNPNSPLYGLIGRNTPFRWGYEVGSPWLEMTGSAGNGLMTPDAAQLAVTGDLDLRVDLALEDWERHQKIAGRYSTAGDNRSWVLVHQSGQVGFYWSPDGTLAGRIIQISTAAVKAYHGQRLTLRVTLDINNGAGGYELRFWTGRTVDDEEWNLLGDPIVGASTTGVFDGAAGIELGDVVALVDNAMQGKLFAFQLRNGINGTIVAQMTTSDAAVGTSGFTSHGLVWTVVGGATLTNKHIRMAGEVPAWPPTRDLSGQDNYVSIQPSGLMRRMDAGNRPQDSALLRYIKAEGPIECWPLTDGPRTTGAKSLLGGQDMQQEILIGEDTAADWQQGSLADWIEPVLRVKANTTGQLRGGLPRTGGVDGFWSLDIFLTGGGIPSAGGFTISDLGSGTDSDNAHRVQGIFTGGLDRITLTWASVGDTSSSSGLMANIDSVGIYDEEPHHLRLSIDPSGGNTDWLFYIDGRPAGSGTISGIPFKAAREVLLGWGFATVEGTTMSDRSFGYITYWDGNGPSPSAIYDAYMGFQGERAGERIERLASEAGYVASVAGEDVYQQLMGIQGQKQLLGLLNEASQTNFGYLLDARDRIEVIHRGQSTLWNQPPALVLDYSAGLIAPPFKPVDDDKLTENDVSVRRQYGSVPARHLEEGELSVLPPEEGGVGRYDTSYTYNLYTDAQASQVAGMRLHLGTYNGVRYTRLTLNLANERVFAYIDDILRIDVGDKIRLTNLPADHGPDDVDVLVAGYTEDAGPNGWSITFNCVPGEPWTAAVVDSDSFAWVDTDGSELAEELDATETEVDVRTTAVARWTPHVSDTPFDWRVGGEVMTVTAPGTLLNGNPFFDADVAGWSGSGTTVSRSTTVVHPHPRAVASMLVTPAGGSAAVTARSDLTAVGSITPGQQYVISGWFYSPAGWSALYPSAQWADSAGGILSSSGTSTAVPAGTWTYLESTVTAPASASRVRMTGRADNTPTASDVFYVWGLRITRTSSSWLYDTFSRTAASSWGTADSGQAWSTSGGTSADYNVTGGYGAHRLASTNVSRRSFTDCTYTDFDAYVSLTPSATATGGFLSGMLTGRYINSDNMYMARIAFNSTGTMTLTLRKRFAASETELASYTPPETYTAGTYYRIRFQASGSTLRAKAWPASDTEPRDWQVQALDTDITTSNFIGVRSISASSNTNVNAEIRFDDFDLANPQTYTVTRSVNGISKTHATGTDVRLATPVYVAM